MSTTKNDWAHPRSAAQHVGYIQDGSNPTGLIVRLVTHGPVPTTAADQAEVKAKRLVGTILSFPKLGFISAPYCKKAKAGAKDQQQQPKPLLVAASTAAGEVTAVKVYGFSKVNSNYDKGPRDDDYFSTLRLGQTLNFYLNEFVYDTKEKAVFPEGCPGVIPPYSVVEVQLNPSHNQSGGYGLKLAKVVPQGPTLYSYLASSQGFKALQRTAEEASAFVKACATEDSATVVNQVEQSRYAFVAAVDRSARVVDVREDLEFLRIECPSGSGATPVPGVYSLDVSFAELQRFTNFPGDVDGARTLVDLAIAAGALKVLATYDDYYNHKEPALGQFRCAPLVDTEIFLAPVAAAELETQQGSRTFKVDWALAHDAALQKVALRVSTVSICQEEGEAPHDDAFDVKACVAPPSPDLVLVSPLCAMDRGYRVLVGNPGDAERGEEPYYVLDCYFNAAPKSVTGAAGGKPGRTTGYKRVRFEDDDA